MKKYYVSILALAALTACSNEEDFSYNPNEIRLTSAISSMTRVNSLDVQSTMIEAGQQVGVTITGAETEHNNIAWTAGTNGELTNSGEPICWGDAGITVNAYHPYGYITDEEGTKFIDFFITEDQSTSEGYLNSDLMYATATSEQTKEAVALNFEHKLSKINIQLENTAETGVDLSKSTISICGVNNVARLYMTGVMQEVFAAGPVDVKAGTETSQASAIIVPQYISSGKKFIKIEAEGKTYYYTLNNDKQFESGKVYTFKLGISTSGDGGVISLSENIEPWADGDITAGDLEEFVDPATKSKIAFDPDVTSLKLTDLIVEGGFDGTLTGNEIYVLRKMLGAAEFDETERGVLAKLDMSGTRIVAGGDSYYSRDGRENMYTENNEMSECMFYRCANLKSIILPEGITEIGADVFSECTSLTSVVIPEGVKVIGSHAFFNCSPMTTITLPESLETIAYNAFAWVPLNNVYCLSINPPVVESGWAGIDSDCYFPDGATLYVPEGSLANYEKSSELAAPFTKIEENTTQSGTTE